MCTYDSLLYARLYCNYVFNEIQYSVKYILYSGKRWREKTLQIDSQSPKFSPSNLQSSISVFYVVHVIQVVQRDVFVTIFSPYK